MVIVIFKKKDIFFIWLLVVAKPYDGIINMEIYWENSDITKIRYGYLIQPNVTWLGNYFPLLPMSGRLWHNWI